MTLHSRLWLIVALALLTATATQAQTSAQRRGADPAVVRSLQSMVWTLQSGSDAARTPIEGLVVPGQNVQMRFQDAGVSIQGACNTLSGSWRLSPQGQLMLGPLAATMKACDTALMKADASLSALLAQHLDVELPPGERPTLRLLSPARQTLVFSGQPTPESLYGQATRLFLEVAPQTVDCVSGVMRGQCLQVRERRFDAQGLRIEPPGEWRVFHDPIQGYTHTPGVRNVVRVNRYQRKQVPADASRYVYVLDLVVESETVAK